MKDTGKALGLAIFVVLAMSLFPTVLCLSRSAGCATTIETEEAAAPGATFYLMNLTYPLCPGWWNGSALVNECDSCGGSSFSYLVNGTSVAANYTWLTTTTLCSLPATVNFTWIENLAHNYTISYCALVISCPLWSLIQLIPVFYIIGVFATVAIAATATISGRER